MVNDSKGRRCRVRKQCKAAYCMRRRKSRVAVRMVWRHTLSLQFCMRNTCWALKKNHYVIDWTDMLWGASEGIKLLCPLHGLMGRPVLYIFGTLSNRRLCAHRQRTVDSDTEKYVYMIDWYCFLLVVLYGISQQVNRSAHATYSSWCTNTQSCFHISIMPSGCYTLGPTIPTPTPATIDNCEEPQNKNGMEEIWIFIHSWTASIWLHENNEWSRMWSKWIGNSNRRKISCEKIASMNFIRMCDLCDGGIYVGHLFESLCVLKSPKHSIVSNVHSTLWLRKFPSKYKVLQSQIPIIIFGISGHRMQLHCTILPHRPQHYSITFFGIALCTHRAPGVSFRFTETYKPNASQGWCSFLFFVELIEGIEAGTATDRNVRWEIPKKKRRKSAVRENGRNA